MPKKTKMALSSFLSNDDGGTSSWADEMDAMPSAPGEFADMGFGYKRGGGDRGSGPYGGGRDGASGGFGDREARPPRADVPFPTQPPFTAFVGNMSFETSQQDVQDFFAAEGLQTTSVRLVTDFNGKSKGFCYAEFSEAEMLRAALGMTGRDFGGRAIRISVAEPPRADASGRSDGAWTRNGPLADLPGRGGSRGGFSERTSSGPPVDSGRDWGDARGSKFTPAAPSSPSMGSSRTFGGDRGGAPSRQGSFRDAPPPSEDRDWGAARGGKFAPAPPAPVERVRPSFTERPSSGEETRDWRARTVQSPVVSESSAQNSPTLASNPPTERKRLQLSARTVSASTSDVTSPTSSSSRASPFGAAVPVDTTARDAAIQEKLAKEKAEAEEKRAAALAEAEFSKKSSNPFGNARPVDNTSREKEVEAKLAKDKEQLEKKMSEAKIAEEKSANPGREWKRPSGPHAGLTGSTPNAPQSEIAKSSEANGKPAPAPKQIAKNQGIRKEGFSYSNIAGKKDAPPSVPPASQSIIPDNVPVKNGEPAAFTDNA